MFMFLIVLPFFWRYSFIFYIRLYVFFAQNRRALFQQIDTLQADLKSYGALVSALCWAGEAQNALQTLLELQVRDE